MTFRHRHFKWGRFIETGEVEDGKLREERDKKEHMGRMSGAMRCEG
jgi:hypothetical protein